MSECHPLDLEVHHAIHVAAESNELPVYVRREHDAHLQRIVDAARAGKSQLCVLVGESSTGKTRACWEAIQDLADDGWRLWHPFDPTRAEAALAGLAAVEPKTVVWLNEAQHYLASPQVGERIAAALRTLLTNTGRAPILVLGTLWPVHWDQVTSIPAKPEHDPHAQSRQLLTGRQVRVPDAFTERDLAAVRRAAESDERLAQALAGAADRRITQFLAGVPALLDRHSHAGPGARAVLDAAMDARRLGCGTDLPSVFLEEAATGYLPQSVFQALDDDWFEDAIAYVVRPVHGEAALLRRTRRTPGSNQEDRCFRLADYMEQHGRRTRRHLCPPASFWEAALQHLSRRTDVSALASAAEGRWRLRYARLLAERARQLPWDEPAIVLGMEPLEGGWFDEDASWPTEHLTCQALADLAYASADASDFEQAAALAVQAAECCQPDALAEIALQHEKAGLTVEASDLAHYAAANGAPDCLTHLAMMREEAALYDQAEHYARAAAEYGLTNTLADLAVRREAAGDKEHAESLWEAAAVYGHPEALANIARFEYEAHGIHVAARTAREALDRGDASYFRHRVEPLWARLWPHGIEPDGTPTPPPHTDRSW
ncbi:ATP-binding protein [Streptomyces ipomoeae]|nr:ATP-binding protein [Streptomyces ipomoeae]